MIACKSLTFIALLLCAILAQSVLSASTAKSAKDSDNENNDDSDSEVSDNEDGGEDDDEELESEDENVEELHPSLSCVLFSDTGCNSECSVLGKAFGHEAEGVCADDDICDCSVTQDTSLDKLWKERFKSKDILQQIKKKKSLSKQVQEILEDPFRTAQEAKETLKPLLSKDQYKDLELADDKSEAAKMKKDGKLDLAAIKKHVSKKLPSTLKTSDKKDLSSVKYKPTLLKALRKAKSDSKEEGNDALKNLIHDVRRTKNKSLGDVVNDYVKKNSVKEPVKEKEDPSVADTITSYVIDELVKIADDKKSAKTTKKQPSKKSKSSGKKAKKSSKKSNDDDDDDDDNDDDTTLGKDRFKLANIDKSVFQRSGQISQTWRKNGGGLSYYKSWGGDISLTWTKGNDRVSIQKSAGTDVSQTWKFGNVNISIAKSAGGDLSETWSFGNSRYQYSKCAGGYVSSNWSSGKTDKKALKKYQRFIDAWCSQNDFLISRAYCVVYSKYT